MSEVEVPFGEWLPSAPDYANPGCLIADNVIPSTNGYKPFRAAESSGETVTDTVFGAEQFFDTAGDSVIVGGTDDSLFIRTTSITETGGLSSIGTGEAWDFCRFNDFVIATGANNDPQYLDDIDSDTSWSALPGSPPEAKRCARVGEFVMLGAISGSPNRIQWSAFNSPATSWAADRLTQAGFADLPKQFGEIQRIVGGRYAIVFQERGISRLSYVGPPVVFRADTVSEDRGTIAPFSVITVGYQTYFLAQDGFYVTDGSSFTPIGTRRVNKWFFENCAQTKLDEVHAAIDWQNECVMWAFQTNTGTAYNKVIIYSWAQQRWCTATIDVGWIVGSKVDPVTLEDLDTLYPDGIDSIPISLDSDTFLGGARRLAMFDQDNEYATFSGSPLEATWETGEFQPAPGRRVHVSEVYPLIEATSWDIEAAPITKDNFGSETVWGQRAAGFNGFCPVSAEGQKMRLRMVKPSGEWDHAQGVQVKFRAAGMR